MNIADLLHGRPFSPPANWRMNKLRIITSAPENQPVVRQLSDTNAQIKARNRAAVLTVIENEPADAYVIAEITGLAAPTVHRIMRGLVDEKLATVFVKDRTKVFRKALSLGTAKSEPTSSALSSDVGSTD